MALLAHQREKIKWSLGTVLAVGVFLTFGHFAFIISKVKEVIPVAWSPKNIRLNNIDNIPPGKATSSFQVIMQVVQGAADGINSPYVLEAEINSVTDTEEVQYTWLLPPGVDLVSGQIEGSLADLKAFEKKSVRIELKNHRRDNQQIHLHVFKTLNRENVGFMAQFNTLMNSDKDPKDTRLSEKSQEASRSKVEKREPASIKFAQ